MSAQTFMNPVFIWPSVLWIALGCSKPESIQNWSEENWVAWTAASDSQCWVRGRGIPLNEDSRKGRYSDDFELEVINGPSNLVAFRTSDFEPGAHVELRRNTVFIPVAVNSSPHRARVGDAILVAKNAEVEETRFDVGIYPFFSDEALWARFEEQGAAVVEVGAWIAVNKNGKVLDVKWFESAEGVAAWANVVFTTQEKYE